MSSDIKQRTYGNRWSPVAEDPVRCVESVWCSTRRANFQCHNRRGKGTDGLYCGTHDPAAVQARRERSEAKHKVQIERDPLTIARKRIEALEGEVAALKANPDKAAGRYAVEQIRRAEAAEARAERLRAVLKPRLNAKALEALKEILEAMEGLNEADAPYLKTLLDWHERARKALEDDKPIRAAGDGR